MLAAFVLGMGALAAMVLADGFGALCRARRIDKIKKEKDGRQDERQ